MSLDKLVDSTQLDTDLTSVANAIRTKGGTSAQLEFPSGFVSAVQAIPTGGSPTGTKQISITANGTTTEDVTNYASAEITVNVPSGGTNRHYIIKDGVIQSGYSFSTYSNTTVTEESDGYVKIYVNGNAYGAAYVNGVDFTNFNTAVLCLFKVSTRYGNSYVSDQYPAFSLGSGNAATGTAPDSYRVIMSAARGNITTDVFALRTESYSSGGNIKFTAAGYANHTYAEIFIKDLYLDSFTL